MDLLSCEFPFYFRNIGLRVVSIAHHHVVIDFTESLLLLNTVDSHLVLPRREDMDSFHIVPKMDIFVQTMITHIALYISQEFFHGNISRCFKRIGVVHESHTVPRKIRDKSLICRVRYISCSLDEDII